MFASNQIFNDLRSRTRDPKKPDSLPASKAVLTALGHVLLCQRTR